MEIVTTREFRANQTKFLTKAKKGDPIVLVSRMGSFKIMPITEKDSLIDSQLCAALDEVKAHVDGRIRLPNAKDIVF